jgi:hypothetical protein
MLETGGELVFACSLMRTQCADRISGVGGNEARLQSMDFIATKLLLWLTRMEGQKRAAERETGKSGQRLKCLKIDARANRRVVQRNHTDMGAGVRFIREARPDK